MDFNSNTVKFFSDLNKAYRNGEPYFECYVSNWDDEEFLTLYRCLRHHYKLKLDIKVRRIGNTVTRHEYFYVDLIHTLVDKNKGFSLVNLDDKMDEIKLKNKIPEVSKVDENVIYVDFKKK